MAREETRSAGSQHVAVVGGGSWGTALAIVAARNNRNVTLWARAPEVVDAINSEHRNPKYLSDVKLPHLIRATASIQEALADARFVVNVVPSHAMRATVEAMRPYLHPEVVLVSATKGIENDSLMRMSEVMADALGRNIDSRFVVLSGPSFAREVAKRDPTAVVAASLSAESSQFIQRELSSNTFRIYTNDDVVGVELGGAVKNVVAIGAGVVRGLGYGANSVAAIVTRGLAEMTRLAVSQGGRVETLAGLAGLGDLVLTCTGELSRNRRVGIELGRGNSLAKILSEAREVAEGIKTTRAVYEMGNRYGVDLPITRSIYSLLYEGQSAQDAAAELMGRPLKRE